MTYRHFLKTGTCWDAINWYWLAFYGYGRVTNGGGGA